MLNHSIEVVGRLVLYLKCELVFFSEFFISTDNLHAKFVLRNLTGDDEFFKEKELDQLSKKIEEIEKWQGEKTLEQSEHPLSEMPKLTVSSIVAKVGLLIMSTCRENVFKNKIVFVDSRSGV